MTKKSYTGPKPIFKPLPEDLRRAKEIFMSTSISMGVLANLSGQLIGKQVNIDHLKEASQSDPDGLWEDQRRRLNKEDGDVTGEVDHLRKMLYEQITLQSLTGLVLAGEFDEQEVRVRLRGVEGLTIKRGSGRVDPQLINAYMNLLGKLKIDLGTIGGVSGKTDLQQAMEAYRRGKAGS